MKILLVDDDPIAGAVLDALLKQLGHEAVMCSDGKVAWEQFQNAPRRLVISDWMMPGLNGLDLCRRIRAHHSDYTYFILLSNLTSSGGNLAQAMQAGVDDFLSKPVNQDELTARLFVAERILNYATQVRQLQEIVPICGYCKKMRDDRNYWSQVEEYLSKQTGTSFSHGVCPDCYDRVLVPQMQKIGVEPPPYPHAERVGPRTTEAG